MCVVKGCGNEVEHGDDLGVCGDCERKIALRNREYVMHYIHTRDREAREKRIEKRAQDQHRSAIQALLYQGTEQPTDTSYVYYVRIGSHIKIGYTTNVLSRLRALRVPIADLLALEPGNYRNEQGIHQRFEHLRVTKRWENFRPEPDLMAHIEEMRDTYGLPAWLNPPRRGRNGPVTVRLAPQVIRSASSAE